MNGSEKQIQWATKIRAQFIADVQAEQERQQPRADKAGQGEQWRATMAQVVALAEAQDSAAWWIDNRDKLSIPGRGAAFGEFYKAALAQVAK